MPNSANTPAPASAPATRAESLVVRAMLIAPISRSLGIVSATSAPRTPRSEGRTSPASVAMMITSSGVTTPANASTIRTAASSA